MGNKHDVPGLPHDMKLAWPCHIGKIRRQQVTWIKICIAQSVNLGDNTVRVTVVSEMPYPGRLQISKEMTQIPPGEESELLSEIRT